jgi:hypothetical protein
MWMATVGSASATVDVKVVASVMSPTTDCSPGRSNEGNKAGVVSGASA